jgi:PAS domain S-box-containing protein
LTIAILSEDTLTKERLIDSINLFQLRTITEFDNILSRFDTKNNQLLDTYNNFIKWEPIRNDVLNSNDQISQNKLALKENQHYSKLKSNMGIMTHIIDKSISELYNRVDDNYAKKTFLIVLISILIISLCLIIALIVTSSISKPLYDFLKRAHKLYDYKINNLKLNEEDLMCKTISDLDITYNKLQSEIQEKEKAKQKIKEQYIEIQTYSEKQRKFNEQLEARVKQRTLDLSESEQRYKSLIEGSTDIILVYEFLDNDKIKLSEFNQTACYTLGYTKQELSKINISEYIEDLDNETLATRINDLKSNRKQTFEQNYISKTGNKIAVETVSQIIKINSRNAILSISRDVTKRKNAQEALVKSERRLRKMILKSPLPILFADETNKVEYLNDKFVQQFGYSNYDIKTIDDFEKLCYPNSDYRHSVKKQWQEVINKSKINETDIPKQELKIHTKYGTDRICELHMMPFESLHMVIFNDITDIDKTQKELVEAKQKAEESDRLKSAFLANMSHEVRTPMNGIIGFSEMLKQENLSSGQLENYIDIIHKSSQQLLKIITDILDISKLDSGQTQIIEKELNLNKLLCKLYDDLSYDNRDDDEINLILDINLPEIESIIIAEERKLIQILQNLLSNAYKFTSAGEIKFGYKLINDKNIEFYVSDTGIGIPEDKQKVIFERFRQGNDSYSGNYGGTGLGLAISKGFVELMGGNIRLETEEDKGTNVYFTIPYKPVHTESIKHKNRSKKNWSDKLVLVVDESETKFKSFDNMIHQYADLKTMQAYSARKAVELSLLNSKIDLIILNKYFNYDEAFESIKAIRKIRNKLPVLFIDKKDNCIRINSEIEVSTLYYKSSENEIINAISKGFYSENYIYNMEEVS